MSYRPEIDRLLARLAREVGDADIKLNAEDSLAATLNDLPFSFHYHEPTETLFIQVYCGDLKNVADQEGVLTKALKANYMWRGTFGGALGLSGDDLTLSYRLDFPLSPEATPDDFLVRLLPHLAGAAECAGDFARQF
jgi:hypothetical protein